MTRDYRDLIGGASLIATGAFVSIHAWRTLPIGGLSSAGPGLFPFALGWILAALGAAILVPALVRSGPPLRPDMRSLAYVALSILAFAVILPRFGLFPATVISVLLSVRTSNDAPLVRQAVLAVCLALLATLVFDVGLEMSLSAFKWPW